MVHNVLASPHLQLPGADKVGVFAHQEFANRDHCVSLFLGSKCNTLFLNPIGVLWPGLGSQPTEVLCKSGEAISHFVFVYRLNEIVEFNLAFHILKMWGFSSFYFKVPQVCIPITIWGRGDEVALCAFFQDIVDSKQRRDYHYILSRNITGFFMKPLLINISTCPSVTTYA